MVEKIQILENICPSCGLKPISANGKCGECLAKKFEIEAYEENSDEPMNPYLNIEEDYIENEPKPYNKDGRVIKPPKQQISPTRSRIHIENVRKK